MRITVGDEDNESKPAREFTKRPQIATPTDERRYGFKVAAVPAIRVDVSHLCQILDVDKSAWAQMVIAAGLYCSRF
jgi:hypothetical protein